MTMEELSKIVAELESVANRLRRLSGATPPETRPKPKNASGGLVAPPDGVWVEGDITYSEMRFSPSGKEHRRVGLKVWPRQDGLMGGKAVAGEVLYSSLWDIDAARDCPLSKGDAAKLLLTIKRTDKGEFLTLHAWESLDGARPMPAVTADEIPF
jgi:hypothetical protein